MMAFEVSSTLMNFTPMPEGRSLVPCTVSRCHTTRPTPWALQRVAHRACETLFAFVDGARKPCESFFAGIVKPARLAFHLGVAEERVREPREHGRHIGMNIDAPGSNALCGHLSPGMPLARRARAQGPVVDVIDAQLNVDVEPMCRHAQNLIVRRVSL